MAPWIAPTNPYDLGSFSLIDGLLPPVWAEGGAPGSCLAPTIRAATLILLEATLSFPGVGLPADSRSLGTLIRIGMQYLLSGEWWILWIPTMFLVVLVIAINLLVDFLRDLFNPNLRPEHAAGTLGVERRGVAGDCRCRHPKHDRGAGLRPVRQPWGPRSADGVDRAFEQVFGIGGLGLRAAHVLDGQNLFEAAFLHHADAFAQVTNDAQVM